MPPFIKCFSCKPIEWLIDDHVHAPLVRLYMYDRFVYVQACVCEQAWERERETEQESNRELCLFLHLRSRLLISCEDRSLWLTNSINDEVVHTGGYANIVWLKSPQLTADHRRVLTILFCVLCMFLFGLCFVENCSAFTSGSNR